ncbi:DNA polymerase III subunit gamma/tau [Saccharibacillus sp. CPCC 101409]|uniref:DNA polymerase III subunit gamma/tau n=1 Tax=Saccharibacillus sp. CPCC 101409 TaxID=3058041 RepID=UPI002673F8A1|nr:DNA polymerase III subunit gamma/tau [Saccharibacillus sp. CPCC 101409]MDO3413136.1 DNA polymerase III subunit gamma/tau [Saccharibacillus sp. CPCC 101409]
MEHIALYRAWRPQSFRDMVGQQHIIRTLQNAIREQRVSHAYLFSGPRGTGKTSAAKILAKAVNCEKGPAPEPCNECETCKRIAAGAVMDVLEIDAASNRGVEEIRDLRDKIKYAPTEVRRKVYIIDEVHMLTTEAFNALLKTLEEPPEHAMFILATTEPHRLPATIISRCQRFDFRRVSLEEQTARLTEICREEQIDAEDSALQYIARLSDGGMRDALSVLDQISAFTEGKVTYEQVLGMTGGIASEQFSALADSLAAKDAGGVLQTVESWMQEGKSADKCMENLLYYFRDLLMIKMVPNSEHMTERVLDASSFQATAERFSKEMLFRMIDTLSRYQNEMKYAVNPQMLFEVALLNLVSVGDQPSAEPGEARPSAAPADSQAVKKLEGKIAELEKKLEQVLRSGVPASGGGEAASSRPAVRQSAPRVSRMAKLPPHMDRYLAHKDDADFKEIRNKWPQVLQRVKEEKVTVHAWFTNGEPVSALEDAVLVAFKNDIHRETIEKQANRQVVEQVLSEYLGGERRLVTIMQKDWTDSAESAGAPKTEVLELEHEEENGSKEPWVDEALNLFGESLVVIKE